MSLSFYNTLSRQKELFVPLDEKEVRMYTCGPTVYNKAHIGNLRAYVFADLAHRTLLYFGYKVKQIMNITDIGHLSDDGDDGEDKMTKGLLREGKKLTLLNMRALAEKYTAFFKEDMLKMNILEPSGMYFASDYVKEDIELIQRLEKKGFTYTILGGIYFDTSKVKDYGKLRGSQKENKEPKPRIDENTEKINSGDFALWKFSKKDDLGFLSPWGKGFPGWHIECSAMGIRFLGEQFDLHTGGVDHIPIHHTNEIAQSECATGKSPFVKYWMHNEHIDMGKEKMAKSGENFITLSTVIEQNIKPESYRLWILMGHYRTKMNFSWESLKAADIAYKKLLNNYISLGEESGSINSSYQLKFKEFIGDDLNTPKAIALLWQLLKDPLVNNLDKKATILDFDKVLGLHLSSVKELIAPKEVQKLLEERQKARKIKDFKESDRLRAEIKKLGYEVKDLPEGQKIHKN